MYGLFHVSIIETENNRKEIKNFIGIDLDRFREIYNDYKDVEITDKTSKYLAAPYKIKCNEKEIDEEFAVEIPQKIFNEEKKEKLKKTLPLSSTAKAS